MQKKIVPGTYITFCVFLLGCGGDKTTCTPAWSDWKSSAEQNVCSDELDIRQTAKSYSSESIKLNSLAVYDRGLGKVAVASVLAKNANAIFLTKNSSCSDLEGNAFPLDYRSNYSDFSPEPFDTGAASGEVTFYYQASNFTQSTDCTKVLYRVDPIKSKALGSSSYYRWYKIQKVSSKIYIATDRGLFYFNDLTQSGQTEPSIVPVSNTTLSGRTVYDFVVSGSSIWLATNYGLYLGTVGADGLLGDSLVSKSATSFTRLAVSGTTIVGLSSNGLKKSTDSGSSWSSLASYSNSSLGDLFISGSNIFYGTGMYNGSSWASLESTSSSSSSRIPERGTAFDSSKYYYTEYASTSEAVQLSLISLQGSTKTKIVTEKSLPIIIYRYDSSSPYSSSGQVPVSVQVSGDTIAIFTGYSIAYSKDLGTTWAVKSSVAQTWYTWGDSESSYDSSNSNSRLATLISGDYLYWGQSGSISYIKYK